MSLEYTSFLELESILNGLPTIPVIDTSITPPIRALPYVTDIPNNRTVSHIPSTRVIRDGTTIQPISYVPTVPDTSIVSTISAVPSTRITKSDIRPIPVTLTRPVIKPIPDELRNPVIRATAITRATDSQVDISSNSIAWSWQEPADFVRDLNFYSNIDISKRYKEKYSDISGVVKQKWRELNNELLEQSKSILNPNLTSIQIKGSNANWGRITQPDELQGTMLEDLGLTDIKTQNVKKLEEGFFHNKSALRFFNTTNDEYTNEICENGDLTASLVKSIEEDADGYPIETSWFCKGCSKVFATKASLKRHHDRKKSCKDICESETTETVATVPDRPYIVEWIDQLQTKAISGDSDKSYCKHCDVEFANKSNLNKHLSKSVACDKLAKQEFLKLLDHS